jgi:hypothetical protein
VGRNRAGVGIRPWIGSNSWLDFCVGQVQFDDADMTRSIKIAIFASLLLGGISLAAYGANAFFTTDTGGSWITTMEDCTFYPDIRAYIHKGWCAVVTVFALCVTYRSSLSLIRFSHKG